MKRPRINRTVVRWTIAASGAVATMMLIVLWLVLFTGVGAKLALRYARARLAPKVTIGSVDGSLHGPLLLRDLRYDSEALTVLIDTVGLEWRLSRLLFLTLDVTELRASRIRVVLRETSSGAREELAPSRDARRGPPPLQLPVRVELAQAMFDGLTLIDSGTGDETVIDSVVLVARTVADTAYVERLQVLDDDLSGSVRGFVRTGEWYPFDLEYDADIRVRDVPIAGRGTLEGDLRHAEVRQEVTRPTRAELRAALDSLLSAPVFTARGSVADFNLAEIDSTWPDVQLGGEFEASGPMSGFRAIAETRLAHEALGPAMVRISVGRSGDAWQFDSVMVDFSDSPTRLKLSGTLVFRKGAPSFDGRVEWSELGWPVRSDPRVLSDGRVRLVGSLADYGLNGRAVVWGPDVPRGEFTLAARGSRDSIAVSGTGGVIEGDLAVGGVVMLSPGFEWRLELEGKRLALSQLISDSLIEVRNVGVLARGWGNVTDTGLAGTLNLSRVSGTIRGAPFSLTAQARLEPNRLILDTAHAEFLEGELLAAGAIAFRPALDGRLRVFGRDLDPALLVTDSAEWTGALSAQALVEARRVSDRLVGRIDLDSVHGVLRDEPLRCELGLAVEGREYTVDTLSLEWGTLSANARARLGQQLYGRAEIDAPDVSIALPHGSGSLHVEVEVGGERATPTVTTAIEGTSLSFDDFRAQRLSVVGGVDLSHEGPFDLSAEASDARVLGKPIERIGMRLTGRRDDHQLEAWLDGEHSAVTVNAAGVLGDAQWSGTLQQVELVDSTAGRWLLERETAIELSRDSAVLHQPICLLSDEAAVCAAGSWRSQGPSSISTQIASLSLDRLTALFPNKVTATGTLSGGAEFNAEAGGALEGRASFSAGSGQLVYQLRSGIQALAYDHGTFEVQATDSGVNARLDVAFTTRGSLDSDSTRAYVDGRVGLPAYRPLIDSLRRQPIDGRFRMRLANLSALETLYPRLADVAGRLEADFTIRGTVAEPALMGGARLTQGSADVPSLGLELRDIQLSTEGEGRAGVRVSGSALSGAGSLRVEGRASVSATADSLLAVRISGDRFQVVNTPEAQVWISPELDVTTFADRVTVDGEVRVPRAVVELREIPAVAVPVSRDAILVGDTSLSEASPLDVQARVRLVMGDSISFRGFGFTGRPSGSLLVSEEPGQPTSATGQLTVSDGRYRAYGQDLAIETGRVIYAGSPVDNPGLDVRAVRHARDEVTAGLEVKGTLKSPEVTVFSEPAMPQSEALAYLLLGRPLSELSSSEGNRVSNAAISLGLSGGNLLAQRVSRRFGIDEAGIETRGSWEQASLYAGKYLSPRLYVSYGYGLFESMSLFRVRYILSRRWTIQAETGETTSTDIHYRIERGR